MIVDGGNILGEGPLWDVDEQRLYWLDSLRSQIWRCAPDGSDLTHWTVPSPIGSMALRRTGGGVLALESGLHLFDFSTGRSEFIVDPEPDLEHTRLNDGKVDRQGRFVVGSLDMSMFSADPPAGGPRGSLYRLDPDLSLHVLQKGGIAVSNGPCWSPDGGAFYFTDTYYNTSWVYDWDQTTGTPSNRRIFVGPNGRPEMPDGATVDSEGAFWIALNGAGNDIGEIRRYAPDGRLLRTISLPVVKLTSVMFGGPNLDILFVTTMGMSVDVGNRPHDGALFAVHGLGVSGLQEPRFAG